MNAMNPLPPSSTAITADPSLAPRGPRGFVVLAWLVILAMGGGLIYWQNEGKKHFARGGQAQAMQLIMLEFQARLFIAIPEFVKNNQKADPAAEKTARETYTAAMEALNRGSLEQRQCVLITLGELAGPERAKEGLIELKKTIEDEEYPLSERERTNLELLTRLYTDYADMRPAAPTITPDERADIEKTFGWFGELALAPAVPDEPPSPKRAHILSEANQTLIGAVVIVGIALLGLVLGLCGLAIIAILSMKGLWKSRLGPPVAHHGVYVETFAIWFPCYFAMAWGMPYVTRGRLPDVAQASLPMILSLGVLAWPVLRGIAWKQVRKDIGLTFGEQPLLEPILGFVSYMNSLPFLIVGFGFTAILLKFAPRHVAAGNSFDPDPSMAHPLIQQLRNATAADVLPYFFLMSVLAPIMEETMFRGCLYRHLRDSTRTWKFGIVFSALTAGLLFAAAHPQGVFAIPLLASLACGFTLAREWRGTLIPSIIAHGLNNSLVLAFAILCLMRW